MYSRLAIFLLISGLGIARPLANPVSRNPLNQDSPASPQNSTQPLPEQKKDQSQEKPGPGAGNSNPSKTAPDPSKLSPDTPVVTIDGFCDQTAIATVVKKAPSGCQSVVTREQFEQLVNALDPNMSSTFRSQLALGIPRILLFSKKAREMGLDNDPRYAQMMKWSSLQVLANNLTFQLQKKAGEVSPTDIETYYKDNSSKFEQCELLRIFIPNPKQESLQNAADANRENSDGEAAMQAEAEKIRAKAASGGDFSALQREAYEAMGITLAPPKVNLGKRIPASLPHQHRQVFDLPAGQVSEVLSDANGFYVYKVVSKQLIPLAEAKDQIRGTLQSERLQASAESLFGSMKSKFNDTYFGKPIVADQGDPFSKPPSSTETAPAQPAATSLDKEWDGSSVRSYLLQKPADVFVAPPESVVPKSAAVITIEGLCDRKPASAADCQTIVTRADFEAMMNAIDPKANTNALKRWAEQYAEWLVHGEKGRQMGLENTDSYKLAMNFLTLNNEFQMLTSFIDERAKQLSDADVKEFYRENPRLFEEIKVVRIVIPQFQAFPPGGTLTPEQNAAGHAAMKKEAQDIAARAALPGADFQALENEGWKASHYIEQPPDVGQPPLLLWEIWPRTRLFIFDLKVGEVSSLIDEPRNGFYVYKFLAKREVPFVEGSAYIRKRYASQRYLDATGRLLAMIKVTTNADYFGEATHEALPGDPGQQSGNDTKIPGLDIKIPKKIEL